MTDGLEHSMMSTPRYSGPATFMRTSLFRDASKLDIALIGVPFDGGADCSKERAGGDIAMHTDSPARHRDGSQCRSCSTSLPTLTFQQVSRTS
jgi:hypothetical protein